MGYYTMFTGHVLGETPFIEEFYKAANDGQKINNNYGIPLSDFTSGSGIIDGEPIKWYSFEEDMIGLSQRFPFILFMLEGEGEESGDIWKSWYRNGKSVTVEARIVFDEPGDLDTILPTPDIVKAKKAFTEKKVNEINERILLLEKQKDALLGGTE